MELLELEQINVGERIKSIRKALNLTQKAFGSRLKIGQDAISDYENRRNEPSSRTIDAIIKEYSINPDWWETGEGEMQLMGVNEPATAYHQPYNAKERNGTNPFENMWVVPAKAQAGFVKGFEQRVFTSQIERVRFPIIQGECFCFEVEGFSMYPDFLPNSYVACTILEDWFYNLRKEKAYVFHTDEGICVKIFIGFEEENITLRSANNNYNPVTPIPMADIRQVYNIELKMERPH